MSEQDTPGDEPPPRSPGAPSFNPAVVDVLDATSRLDDAVRTAVSERLAAALAVLRATGEVRVRIADDREMIALHDEHMNDPTTTDVLTFDLSGDDDGPLDVDLILCLDEATRQAAARGHAIADELLLYAVHGVLHCRGFDDTTAAAAKRMHAEEDRVLEAIGVGAVYARPEQHAASTSTAAARPGVTS